MRSEMMMCGRAFVWATTVSVTVGGCTSAVDEEQGGFTFDGGAEQAPPITQEPADSPKVPKEQHEPFETENTHECAQSSGDVRAVVRPSPVDIIWVVDSSGSMSYEADRVQENMNRFASFLQSSNIDARFVLVAVDGFVQVPPPLGTDAERFLHVPSEVYSHNALTMLLEDFGSYAGHLRDNSMLHVVTVTDDDSEMKADCFLTQMRSLLQANNKANGELRVHTFSSEPVGTPTADQILPWDGNSGQCGTTEILRNQCDGAEVVGREHYRAAALTGGAAISICTEDWSGAFDLIVQNVTETVETVGCELTLPPVPQGNYLDLDKVNVTAQGADGTQYALSRVAGVESCDHGSWHVDDLDNPTQVHLCQSACDSLAALGATVDIGVQCAWTLR